MHHQENSCHCQRLCILSFGFSAGAVWGLGLFLLGLANIWGNWGSTWITFLADGYIGFEATFLGAVIGGIWGFVDLFIAGCIFALIYNFCAKCCCKNCSFCCKKKSAS